MILLLMASLKFIEMGMPAHMIIVGQSEENSTGRKYTRIALKQYFKGAGSFHIHRKTMKELGILAVLGVREQPNLAHNLVTH